MYYHKIETVLRLHEFGIQDRPLRRQITKIVNTSIQYTFQWDFPLKTKVAMGGPYINSDCDVYFLGNHSSSKATIQVISKYLSEFRVFCANQCIASQEQCAFGLNEFYTIIDYVIAGTTKRFDAANAIDNLDSFLWQYLHLSEEQIN